MKKILISFILAILNLIAVYYLLLPLPNLPDLPNSVRSQEPGDTVQISNVKAYYTNLSRDEVMAFYRQNYQSPLRINLNHPPEKAKEIIRNTIQSYYFEELIIPFKESLYINGFEWENDVFTKPEKRIKNQLEYEGVVYKSKVTIRNFPVSIPKRLISFILLESLLAFLYFNYRSMLKQHD